MSGAEDPREWAPAFEGQRPPFQPGHELSTHHGYYSPRKVDPLATELVDSLLADASVGYLKAAAFRPALWAWARAEAQVQLLTEFLASRSTAEEPVGDLDDDRVKAAYLLLHRAETRAASGRSRLGLDPLSRARLGKDVAQGRAADAASIMAELERLQAGGHLPADGQGAGS